MEEGPALYVGGDFSTSGDTSAQRIAKWVACPSATLGDLDWDGIVGASDLLILLSAWGPCDECYACGADLNDDCIVGASDLLILLVNWGWWAMV